MRIIVKSAYDFIKDNNYQDGCQIISAVDLDATAKNVVSKALGQYILDGESKMAVAIFGNIAQNARMKLVDANEILRKYTDTYWVLSRNEA